jgi:hypothetical protein
MVLKVNQRQKAARAVKRARRQKLRRASRLAARLEASHREYLKEMREMDLEYGLSSEDQRGWWERDSSGDLMWCY